MKERWIWIVGLVVAVTTILAAEGSLSSKLTVFAILGVAAVACEAITRWSIAKADGIRQGRDR